jgi:SAM-dependent methyltransferase
MPLPKLYGKLAPWFHLLTAPKDYAEEAAFYRKTFTQVIGRKPKTLLELGSGGGNNASHMKRYVRMTLVDLSPRMLALSRSINPECEHRRGDMRTVRLGREFDAVFVHDAIMYMSTDADLRATMETAYAHLRPGGAALFVPDYTRETFEPNSHCGGHDDPPTGRGLRYLEWTSDPDPLDTEYDVDFAMLLREADGAVRIERDHHVFGLFSRAEWLRLLREAGFRPRAVRFRHSELAVASEVFVGVRPSPPDPSPRGRGGRPRGRP